MTELRYRAPVLALFEELGRRAFFAAGPFRCSGHPTDREDVIAWCREAAKGILSGSCRIVVHYRGRRAVGSELQHGSSCRL